MLKAEGFVMFSGSARISPKNGATPFWKTGTWLYRSDTGCWYVNGSSYVSAIVDAFCEEGMENSKAKSDGKDLNDWSEKPGAEEVGAPEIEVNYLDRI